MTNTHTRPLLRLALIGVALALAAGSAFAGKPTWPDDRHNKGKPHHQQQSSSEQGQEDGERKAEKVAARFDKEDRRIVKAYYGKQAGKGNCPPGLAKKNNGCLPPGQAKKWQKGQPLARNIEYHDLPRELRKNLPEPPRGHRYIQVAEDVLMVTKDTLNVVDAIENILP